MFPFLLHKSDRYHRMFKFWTNVLTLHFRKVPEWSPDKFNDTNTGDDIAGIVEQVGNEVFEFRPGDRVAAFHTMRTPAGSYAEYACAEQHTTWHIPKKTSFEGTSP